MTLLGIKLVYDRYDFYDVYAFIKQLGKWGLYFSFHNIILYNIQYSITI